ncbi:retrovirus-related pol polyprotein from transposon TNT 1-94 [Tanacetum coccineum]
MNNSILLLTDESIDRSKQQGGKKISCFERLRRNRSDEECSTLVVKYKEYRKVAFRDFQKFFKAENPNHLIRECPKPPKDKNQRAFVGGSWSNSGEEDDEKAKDETCLMVHASSEICLGVNFEPDEWIKDSECSKHMKGNQKLFSSLSFLVAIFVVTSLAKCKVIFYEHDSEITKDGKVIGHANMPLIQSLASKQLVRNLPKVKFDQHFCDACKIGKQAHASHKAKNIVSATRFLELLHMDLFSPSAVRSYGGNLYTLVIIEEYSKYTWTIFLKIKTEAFEQYKTN